MISRDKAKESLASFFGMAGYPSESAPERVKIMLDVFQDCARDNEHCDRIVTALVKTSKFMPLPREIYFVAKSTATPRPVGCQKCDGTGFLTFTVGCHSYAKRCHCRVKHEQANLFSQPG